MPKQHCNKPKKTEREITGDTMMPVCVKGIRITKLTYII